MSHTTSVKDTGVKLRLYQQSGVCEYLLVRPTKQKLLWNVLEEGKFQELRPDGDGILRSRVFPGLWLNPTQLWNGDFAGMAAIIQQGSSTPEHASFISQLARRTANHSNV